MYGDCAIERLLHTSSTAAQPVCLEAAWSPLCPSAPNKYPAPVLEGCWVSLRWLLGSYDMFAQLSRSRAQQRAYAFRELLAQVLSHSAWKPDLRCALNYCLLQPCRPESRGQHRRAAARQPATWRSPLRVKPDRGVQHSGKGREGVAFRACVLRWSLVAAEPSSALPVELLPTRGAEAPRPREHAQPTQRGDRGQGR